MTIPSAFHHIKSYRRQMVTLYNIVPVRRFQCLPKKPVSGLYKTITDKAYQFTAQKKGSNDPIFVFHTGHSVGDELLKLLNQSLPPLETWETAIGNVGNGGNVGAGGPGLDPLNAQFLRLLNLFYLRYEYDPKQPSGQIFSRINEMPMVPQHNSLVAFNTVLNRLNTTSADLVQWLTTQVAPAQVPNIRAFNFDLLHDYLVKLPTRPAVIAIS